VGLTHDVSSKYLFSAGLCIVVACADVVVVAAAVDEVAVHSFRRAKLFDFVFVLSNGVLLNVLHCSLSGRWVKKAQSAIDEQRTAHSSALFIPPK
jgi:hypothetical protein